jgi:hypothetical protein
MMTGQYNLTETGRGLGFIGRPYEHDPRWILSLATIDWQARAGFDQLHRDLLVPARIRRDECNLGALLRADGGSTIEVSDCLPYLKSAVYAI